MKLLVGRLGLGLTAWLGLARVLGWGGEPGKPAPAPIMTFEEYARGPLPPMPHVLVLSSGEGRLFYFGVRHTFDPADWQVRAIEDYWRQCRPTVAFNEGHGRPVLATRDDTVAHYGESGLVCFLARAEGVPVRSLEPPIEEEYALLLRSYSPEQVKLFYVLRGVVQFRKSRNDESLEQFAGRVVSGLSSVPGLGGAPASLAEFEACYARRFPAPCPSDWRDAPDAWFDPAVLPPVVYTQRISRLLSEFRDRHMVNLFLAETKKGGRIFAVVGGSHVIMQEKALRSVLTSGFGP